MILDGFKLFCHWLAKSVVHFTSKRLIFYASEMCNNDQKKIIQTSHFAAFVQTLAT